MKCVWLVVLVGACANDSQVCGDGVLDDGEKCDDGNGVGGDGCTALCSPEEPVDVSWAFYPSVDGPPATGPCRSDVATIEMVNTMNQETTIPCDERRSTQIFVPWSQQVIVRLRALDGTIVADSLPQTPTLIRPNWPLTLTASFYEDAGYVRVSYRFAQSCSPTTFVGELVLTAADGTETHEPIGCKGFYVSVPRKSGVYDLEIRTTTLGNARLDDVSIGDNNAITDLQLDLK